MRNVVDAEARYRLDDLSALGGENLDARSRGDCEEILGGRKRIGGLRGRYRDVSYGRGMLRRVEFELRGE